MYNCILQQIGWSLLIFPEQSEASGGAILQIASSVGRSEPPKALNEYHRSLPQGNPAAVSDILDNPENVLNYLGFPVTANESLHRIGILFV